MVVSPTFDPCAGCVSRTEMRPPFCLCCMFSFVSSNAATSSLNRSAPAASERLHCSFSSPPVRFVSTRCLQVHNIDRWRRCAAVVSAARRLAPPRCRHLPHPPPRRHPCRRQRILLPPSPALLRIHGVGARQRLVQVVCIHRVLSSLFQPVTRLRRLSRMRFDAIADCGYGCIARQDIAPGDVVITVPAALVISSDAAMDSRWHTCVFARVCSRNNLLPQPGPSPRRHRRA